MFVLAYVFVAAALLALWQLGVLEFEATRTPGRLSVEVSDQEPRTARPWVTLLVIVGWPFMMCMLIWFSIRDAKGNRTPQ